MAKKAIETQIKEKKKSLENAGNATGRKTVYPNIAYDFQRKKYYVTFDYGVVKGKRRKMQSTYTTPKEAAGALEQFYAGKVQDNIIVPDSITMDDYCKHWLAIHGASKSEATKIFYANIIDNHISPLMGKKRVQDITTLDVNAFLATKLEMENAAGKTLSPTSVKKYRDTLCTIFEAAMNEDIIMKNPAKRSHEITIHKKPVDAFTVEEVQKIIECAIKDEKTPHSEAYRLALYTGMRKGELLGLKWENVHLGATAEESYIDVQEARTDTTKGVDTKGLKTDSSLRTLRVAPDAFAILEFLQKRYLENKKSFGDFFQDNGFVLCKDDGSIYLGRSLNRAYNKFLQRNGFRHLPFHALRHTFGTLQRMTGASAYDIKEMLGHSSVVIAEKNYIKPFAAQERQTAHMAKMQDIIKGDANRKKD